ncbi:protein vein isoform X2 [Aethina tumida]|uniref:protein vein isoform X2 n=1 Tax=Aethina tumida TaxID=116153 RepID=UPI0021490A46|nr:protein vein isoform X2 [Aethina tumida]
MYKISYEKCVCFIFLVILAVLSCSGFRIDNLAMTDITKRNSNSDPNSPKTSEIFDRIFHQTQTPQTLQNPAAVYRHRIRHHRNLRAQARTHDRTHPPTGHTGTLVFPPGTQPSQVEHLRHQIPPTTHLQPTSPVATRSQRSPQNPKNRGTKRPLRCQREDISRKLYLAPIVVHAKVESLSGSSHPIHFKVLEVYKNSSLPVDDTIILTLHRKKSPMNCERNERFTLSQDYILFLRSFSAHNYTLFAASERLRGKSKARQKILNIVRKFTRPNFIPKPPKVHLNATLVQRGLKLVCKARGSPIPLISWTRNGVELHRNSDNKITYNKKRRSTLIVKKDGAKYECKARGVNGTVDSKFYIARESEVVDSTSHIDSGSEGADGLTDCPEDAAKGYCYNGGTCRQLIALKEMLCQCPENYSGLRCITFTPPGRRSMIK